MDRFKIILACSILVIVDFFIGYKLYRFYRMPVAADVGDAKENLDVGYLVPGGPPADGIPAIDDPSVESVAAADEYLDDQGFGIVLEHRGLIRFYPYQVLVWHQVVNETLAGQLLAITYDPLSGAAIVFDRTVQGVDFTFGVSGKLLNSHLVLFDRNTASLWSQIKGEAITGEKNGTVLTRIPSAVSTWAQFKETYPKGSVLSRQTGFVRDYTRDPYRSYESSYALWFPVSSSDARLESKTVVFGFRSRENEKVFPRQLIKDQKIFNDEVGDSAISLMWDDNLETARVFSSIIADGTRLTFKQKNKNFIDEQTNSVWNEQGNCISGSLRTQQLIQLPLTQLYWFAWAAEYPRTGVVGKG